MSGDKPKAKPDWLPRDNDQTKGFFGKLKKLLATSDLRSISANKNNLLPEPGALGMLLLFD